jgi:uncharacterized protein YlxP (DUF503 family)
MSKWQMKAARPHDICRPHLLFAICHLRFPMVIGILQFELVVRGAESLKDKRRVVRSVKDKLHREHQVSVAEVAAQDALTLAAMGLAAVGADGQRIGEVLDRITAKLRSLPDGELGACVRQVIHGSQLDPEPAQEPDPDAIAREMLEHFNAGRPPEAGEP